MRKMLIALSLAAAVTAAHAQVMSHTEYRDARACKQFADSASFVAAESRAGATDAQIEADMRAFDMRPLPDHLRQVLEQNARVVTPNEVLHASYVNCMRGMGH